MTQLAQSKLPVIRGSVIIAALLSLCISSNVGPQFLPLPSIQSACGEFSQQQLDGIAVTRLRFDEPAGFRVPMAPAQKRDRTAQDRLLALMPGVYCVVRDDFPVAAQGIDPKTSLTSALAAPSPGRAPPIIRGKFTV